MKFSIHGLFRYLLIISCLFILLAGCDNFDWDQLLEEDVKSSLEIVPSSFIITVNANYTMAATGGTPPYTFSTVSGSGSITAGGVYTAPGSPGVDVLRVTDSTAVTADAVVAIVDAQPLTIIPPAITLSTNDVYFFTAVGGTPPYSYARIAGTGTIDPVTGEFQAPGSADTTTIEVTDALSATDQSTVTIVEGLVIIPQTVSVPANNNVAFSASGGTPPYTYAMVSGAGSVTPGGLYTAPGATGTDRVKVTDNGGDSRIATVTVTAPQPLNIVPSSFIILANDNHTFTATGGTPPYTFSKVSGSGSITVGGVYTAPGSPGVGVLRVTDSGALTADAVVTIVNFGALTIEPATVTVEQNDSFKFSASGGNPLYTYSVIAGSGFVNSSTGDYTAPLTLGVETVRVTDSALNTADATVNVAPAAPSNLVADGTVPGPQDILLTWTDNATGEDGFSIERKLSGGAYSEIITVGPNVTSHTDTLLSPNIPYSYRVRAYTLPGPVYSAYSNDDFDIPNS